MFGALLTFGGLKTVLIACPLLHLVAGSALLARCRRERSHTAPESV